MRASEIFESWTDWSDTLAGFNALKSTAAQRAALPANATDALAQAQKSREQTTTAADQAKPAKTTPLQGTIFLTNVGGMEYFKNYLGQWFEKPDSANRYSASRALQITDPVKTARLEQTLPQAKTLFVKPESPGNNIVFVPDPTGRTAKLAAKHQKVRT